MNRTRRFRFAPRIVAGLAGALLAVALFIANGLLSANGGRGLSPVWLLTLLLPGAVAAQLALRSNARYSWAKEAAFTGVITGSVVAVVWAVWLIIAVARTDWTRYAQQAGSEIANAVREAAAPATALAILMSAVVAYIGCILASLIGAAVYSALRDVAEGRRMTDDRRRTTDEK